MFNLLPKEERKETFTEYKFRLLTLAFVFLGLTGVITLVLLLPSFLLTNFRYSKTLDEINILETETPELKNTENMQASVKITEDRLNILKNQVENTPLSIWEKVIEKKPAGIKIKSLFYNKKSENEIRVVVSGVSLSRESLTVFARNLDSVENFNKVDLPVSNLAREKDLDFSISFSVGI